MINVIDAFYDFKEGFKENLESSTEGKIELWEKIYSNKYPELLNKCKEDYINEGYKLDEIATIELEAIENELLEFLTY